MVLTAGSMGNATDLLVDGHGNSASLGANRKVF